MHTPFPEEREPHAPSFEADLQSVLAEAEQLPGSFTIEGDRAYAYVTYHDVGGQTSSTEDARPLRITIPGSGTPEGALNYARSQHDSLVEQARQYVITRRKASGLIDALRRTDIQPDNLVAVTDHTLRMLPDFAAAGSAHNHLYFIDVAHALLRRALDLTPESCAQALSLLVAHCNYFRTNLDEKNANLADKFIKSMVTRLEIMVSLGRVDVIDKQPRGSEWRYDSQGEHIAENAVSALEIFDAAGLVPHTFWHRLLKIPLQSQSLSVITLLARKLNSDDAEAILGNVNSIERGEAIENAVATALDRAAAHEARDSEKVASIRRAIAGSKARPEAVSLGNLVALAGKVIEQNYKDQFTPLRPESSFADSAQALALLLQVTLNPDASPADLSVANSEATVFLHLISGIIEHAKVKQGPIIKTVGDLALRFADATPTELRLLRQALDSGGVSRADALRKQQLRGQRRDTINKPGYGELS